MVRNKGSEMVVVKENKQHIDVAPPIKDKKKNTSNSLVKSLKNTTKQMLPNIRNKQVSNASNEARTVSTKKTQRKHQTVPSITRGEVSIDDLHRSWKKPGAQVKYGASRSALNQPTPTRGSLTTTATAANETEQKSQPELHSIEEHKTSLRLEELCEDLKEGIEEAKQPVQYAKSNIVKVTKCDLGTHQPAFNPHGKVDAENRSLEVWRKRLETMPSKFSCAIKQVPWTRTVRQNTIGAEFMSPGPAYVPLLGRSISTQLPKKTNVTCTFGNRPAQPRSDGPGPATYNVSGLSSKGKANSPAMAMHAQLKRRQDTDQTPSPWYYKSQEASSAPKYTFGEKPRERIIRFVTPGPNAYFMPEEDYCEEGRGISPGFSLSGWHATAKHTSEESPGPGAYDSNKTQPRGPLYSLRPLVNYPCDRNKPGPAHYYPEKVTLHKSWTAAHSFGIKHSTHKALTKPPTAKCRSPNVACQCTC